MLSAWVVYNIQWDRLDKDEDTQQWVDYICTFVNPEAMAMVKAERGGNDGQVEYKYMKEPPQGPEDVNGLPEWLLERVRSGSTDLSSRIAALPKPRKKPVLRKRNP